MTPRISRRTLLGSIALASLAGGLSACASGSAGSTATAGGTRNISFMFWGPDFYQQFTRQMVDAFTKANPTIAVETMPSEWNGYWDKLATMTAGQNPPDVINMDGKYLAEYGGRGVLADLREVPGLDLSSLSEADLQAGTYEDKLYALSTGWNAFAIFANPAVFEAAGVAMPDDKTWTWPQMLETATAITKGAGGPVGLTGGGTYADATIFLRQNGEDLFKGNGVGYSDETLAKWFQWHVDVMNSGAGLDAAKATEDGAATYEQNAFATGNSAMFWSWSNQLPNARKATGNDGVVMLRPPSPTGNVEDNGLFLKATMFWSIAARSKDPEAAGALVNFLMNDPAAAEIQLVNRGVPSSPTALAAMESKLGETDRYVVDWLGQVGSEITMAPPAIQPEGGADNQNSIARALQEVRFGTLTPLDAAKRVTAETQEMLA